MCRRLFKGESAVQLFASSGESEGKSPRIVLLLACLYSLAAGNPTRVALHTLAAYTINNLWSCVSLTMCCVQHQTPCCDEFCCICGVCESQVHCGSSSACKEEQASCGLAGDC